ncbi:MAG: CHAP domain-containing protein, partial [Anaerolineae bacterium]|nr:CHAP domain-containing protein [Anaerolineae bacterium]
APYRYNIDATTVLPDRMVPGDLVVWNRGQQGVNSEHGHVAIIMEVHDNSVIVKETDWGNVVDTWREIPRSKLQELAFVGQP